ncbi:unnamed protein product [Dovyalis caffra]|uniref:Uncharacterized protein n=1 Tax=Dovyalis caffra TaxID=77055 RepID=A0AAV1RXL1_9ROSI|nr:unnamed protein product [Dovyalis caffra]
MPIATTLHYHLPDDHTDSHALKVFSQQPPPSGRNPSLTWNDLIHRKEKKIMLSCSKISSRRSSDNLSKRFGGSPRHLRLCK